MALKDVFEYSEPAIDEAGGEDNKVISEKVLPLAPKENPKKTTTKREMTEEKKE